MERRSQSEPDMKPAKKLTQTKTKWKQKNTSLFHVFDFQRMKLNFNPCAEKNRCEKWNWKFFNAINSFHLHLRSNRSWFFLKLIWVIFSKKVTKCAVWFKETERVPSKLFLEILVHCSYLELCYLRLNVANVAVQ